jgi:ABC-type multidrug transport system permease subunit
MVLLEINSILVFFYCSLPHIIDSRQLINSSWQVVIELPYALAQDILYGVIVYSMIGFEWTAAKFFWYLFFGYFTLLYFTFYGMMAVGLTPNYHIASIVSSAFYAIWNLFSGFIIPRPVSPHHDPVLTQLLLFTNCFHSSFPFFCLTLRSEGADLVEVVLLDMPCGVDAVWAGGVTVWRCDDDDGQWQDREGVHRGLL